MAQQAESIAIEEGLSRRASRSLYVEAMLRLVREKPLGLVGLLLVLMFVIMAIFAPIVATHGPNAINAADRLQGPSFSHFMGTDNMGRDLFSRVVWGARISIMIGLIAVMISTLISLTIGIASGFFGGWIDLLFQRLIDAFIAFPGLVFILAVVAIFRDYEIPFLPAEGIFRTENFVLMATIGTLLGVGSSRIIRGATLSVKASPYLEAAQSIGATDLRLMTVHVLPNVLPPIITLATLGLGTAILLEATLSFLGLGVPPDVATWGGMLNREARAWMTMAPWLAIFPGIALSLAVFGFNMLGDGLRDVLDPRLRGS